jgi:hypothetical protein
MGLTMKERYAIIRELAPRYQKARKRERSKILDEFVRLSALVRSYASHVLKHSGTRKRLMVDGQPVVVIVGQSRLHRRQRPRRPATLRQGNVGFLETEFVGREANWRNGAQVAKIAAKKNFLRPSCRCFPTLLLQHLRRI